MLLITKKITKTDVGTLEPINIGLTRGDSAYIDIELLDKQKNPIELADGDIIKIQVRDKEADGELVFEGQIITDVIDEDYTDYYWYIRPSDTKDLELTTYYYDIEVELENGDVFTIVPTSEFTLLTDTTKKDG